MEEESEEEESDDDDEAPEIAESASGQESSGESATAEDGVEEDAQPEEEESEEEESEDEEEEESVPDEVKELHELLDRDESPLSRLAYRERSRVPIPNVTTKWISPLRQIFNSRRSAWENAVELCRNEVLIDKNCCGYGASGQPIKATWPSKNTSLKTGRIRFERDGLWV